MSDVEISMEASEPDAFETALMQALRRVEAPSGFAEDVMKQTSERVEARDIASKKFVVMRSRFASLSRRAWIGGAIAAMLVLGVFGGEQAYMRHEREQAALANRQFETATRITDHALDQVRAQLAQAGVLQDE